MSNPRVRDLRGASRRDFIRLVGVAGAAFGLQRSRVIEYLLDEGGEAMAGPMCAASNRSVHLVSGNGNLGWWQLLWPHLEVPAASPASGFAYHSYNNPGTLYTPPDPRDHPFYYAPEAPWQKNGMPTRPVTGFLTGRNETHTQLPTTPAVVSDTDSMLGVITSIQRANPCLIPVIGMEPVDLGNAPGMPSLTSVPNAAGMVELFNSAASQGILAAGRDKALYETYYKAIVGLRDLAGRPTWTRELQITKAAANLVGRNLGTQLTPTAADLAAYGVTALLAGGASPPAKVALENLGRAMITTAKAFKLGLTNCAVLSVTPGAATEQVFTDPHESFNDMTQLRATVVAFGAILDGFYADLATAQDPACAGKNLDRTTILTVHGDTPKTPFQASAWPDMTPNNSNWMYVMGNDYLATGWFGAVHSDGSSDGFDPTTGANVVGQTSLLTSNPAGAAVAYAVARGDLKVVDQFYKGPDIAGIIKPPPP